MDNIFKDNLTKDNVLIGGIQRFSISDGPGIRSTVFIKGCPLNCKWCHNPELISRNQELNYSKNNCIKCGHCIERCPQKCISFKDNAIEINRLKCTLCLECTKVCYAKALRPVGKSLNISEIVNECVKDKEFYENTGGGVTISGGELLMHAQFVKKLIVALSDENIKVCLDTCGFGNWEDLYMLSSLDNVENILFDIKLADDSLHKFYTGVSNELILKNLERLAKDNNLLNKIIARFPLIKGVNDNQKEIIGKSKIVRDLKLKKVTLLPYHKLGISKDSGIGKVQEEFETPSEEELGNIAEIIRSYSNATVEVSGREN